MSATSPAFTVLSDAGSCGVRGKEKISAEDSDIVGISHTNEKHISDVLHLLDDDMTIVFYCGGFEGSRPPLFAFRRQWEGLPLLNKPTGGLDGGVWF